MASINRDLREQLLSRTKKQKFRVQMLNASQQKLRAGLSNKLHLKQRSSTIVKGTRSVLACIFYLIAMKPFSVHLSRLQQHRSVVITHRFHLLTNSFKFQQVIC